MYDLAFGIQKLRQVRQGMINQIVPYSLTSGHYFLDLIFVIIFVSLFTSLINFTCPNPNCYDLPDAKYISSFTARSFLPIIWRASLNTSLSRLSCKKFPSSKMNGKSSPVCKSANCSSRTKKLDNETLTITPPSLFQQQLFFLILCCI